MSIERAKSYLKQFGLDDKVIELSNSTATVNEAAAALNTAPGKIAKTLTFYSNVKCLVIIAAGDARIDNKKFKNYFGIKPKMLTPDDVTKYTGHEIGGVCPFGIDYEHCIVYCDVSLKKYEKVYPACGSSNSAICLNCDELFAISNSVDWIDVCGFKV